MEEIYYEEQRILEEIRLNSEEEQSIRENIALRELELQKLRMEKDLLVQQVIQEHVLAPLAPVEGNGVYMNEIAPAEMNNNPIIREEPQPMNDRPVRAARRRPPDLSELLGPILNFSYIGKSLFYFGCALTRNVYFQYLFIVTFSTWFVGSALQFPGIVYLCYIVSPLIWCWCTNLKKFETYDEFFVF